MAPKPPSLSSKIVPGGQSVSSVPSLAKIGGGLAVAGLAMIGSSAFLKTPQAVSQSKYKGDLTFPKDLIDPSADRNSYIAIEFQEYQRRSIFDQPFLNAIGGIHLPIPSQLSDNQQLNYEQKSGDPITGAAIEAGLKGRNNNNSSLGGAAVAQALGGAAAGIANKAASVAGSIVGIDTAQALQLGGLAQNPFLTVLFNSPTFKKHNFSWKLAPNNSEESEILKNIINTFKSNMLPAIQPNVGGTLLTYPNMAKISLYPNPDYLYKFKPCVIESMDVNYAIGGQPSFFKGTNAPTEVQISINFLEIEYWLKEDIENETFRAGGFGFSL
jgi:hypothetical protein